MNQPLHDSGKRRTFTSGAVRDRGDLKPRPDLISPHAQMREGMIMTLGAEKYSLRNWEKGLPIGECLASAQRHIEQFKRGDTDEDHIAQARWNLGVIIHYEEEIKAGRLPADLDDMPHYATPKGITHKDWDQLSETMAKDFPPNILYESPPEVASLKNWTRRTELQRRVNAGELLSDRENNELSVLETSTFYVAGPMRGYKNFNFEVFDAVATLGRNQGYHIISPAELDREHGIDPINDPESVKRAFAADPNLIQTIVRRDTEVIINLKQDRGDGLILLPDWRHSTGTRAETALAIWLGLRFKTALRDVNGWSLQDVSLEWVGGKLFGSQ